MKEGDRVLGWDPDTDKDRYGTVVEAHRDYYSGQVSRSYTIQWDGEDQPDEESYSMDEISPVKGEDEVSSALNEAFAAVERAQQLAKANGYDLHDYDCSQVLRMVRMAGWSTSSMFC